MDVDKIRSLPRNHKKTYIALLCAVYAILLLLTYYGFGETLKDIALDQIRAIADALITVFFAFLVVVPFFPQKGNSEIEELHPQQITSEFEELLRNANRWRYRGNFGRYFRGKVLPTLSGRQNVHVSACLIDPCDVELCRKHADYRGMINAIDKGRNYDENVVSMEIIVTIVLASWYVVNRQMNVEIYLSGTFDPIRIDSNDYSMILTVEDRRSPALKISNNHFTSQHFELQMASARQQARKINLGGVRQGIELPEINEEDIKSVIVTADVDEVLGRISLKEIQLAFLRSKNPYEN